MAEAAYLATMDKKVHECSKEVELKKKIVYEGFKRKKIAKELRRLGKEKSMNVPLLRRKKHWKKSGSLEKERRNWLKKELNRELETVKTSQRLMERELIGMKNRKKF